MPTPFDLAAGIYESEPCANTFEHDLLAHHQHGYVFSTPESFIMGRPVDKAALIEEILDIEFAFPREKHSAWLVWAFAGDIRHALRFLPYRLPWVIFQRKNELRVYPMERFEGFLSVDNVNMALHQRIAE